ncbi:MAG: PD40 domain-containing protein [Saprospiraceae bacterium]|nr:PD40 domain-containing protein [Saprospiraceae bacterium]
MRITLVFMVCIGAFSAVFAQKPADLLRNGQKAFDDQRWREAQTLLAQYQAVKPGNFEVLTQLGIAHYQLKEADKARKYLDYIVANQPNAEACYYQARTLHGQGEWEKAITAYKSYLRIASTKDRYRENSIDNIRRCVHAPEITRSETVALVENIGDRINSEGDEFAPLPSLNHADKLYFSASNAKSIGGMRNDRGYEDAQRGHYCSDMMSALRRNTGWELAGNLGALLNTPRHEVALGFNENGQILYFFRGFTLFSGEIFADTAARKDEYAVTPPSFKSPFAPENGDTAPFFFNDSTLIFASRRDGGQGGLDLWFCRKKQGEWTTPENLGADINSAYDETTPFLTRDGLTLYFSSNRNTSLGGHDVFSAAFDQKMLKWNAPQNMGAPVNSPGDDTHFRLDSEGQTGYFCSDRLSDNFGQRDLYVAYFKELQTAQRPLQKPVFFADVAPVKVAEQGMAVRKVTLPTIFYDNESELMSPENRKVLEHAAAIMQQLPAGATLFVSLHSATLNQSRFDLYNGIKSLEPIGRLIGQQGVAPERVVLRSCGSAYPVALAMVEGQINPTASRLNNRVTLRIGSLQDKLPVEVVPEYPVVSDLMANPAARQLDSADMGLSFRVEVAVTRQILNDDALGMFDRLMIESPSQSGAYAYTAGLFREYAPAAKLCEEMKKAGFPEAKVKAYVQGIFVPRAAAVAHLKKWPELAGYVRG